MSRLVWLTSWQIAGREREQMRMRRRGGGKRASRKRRRRKGGKVEERGKGRICCRGGYAEWEDRACGEEGGGLRGQQEEATDSDREEGGHGVKGKKLNNG